MIKQIQPFYLLLPFLLLLPIITSGQDCSANSDSIETTDGFTEITICAGDSISDAFDVLVSDSASGENSGWLITDSDGIILAKPDGPTFDLEGAGIGVCQIWYLTYDGDISGAEVGLNANNLQGCFDLSNPITVTRTTKPEAGSIAIVDGAIDLTICSGDDLSDAFEAVNTGATGDHFAWVITDPDQNILGLPDGPTFDLEGVPTGTCLVWYLSYNGNLQDVAVGNSVSEVFGCFDLSNPITVTRLGVNAGMITTTDGLAEFTMCAGDGISDAFDVLIAGELDGDSTGWIIADPNGNILGVPPGPPFDLEGAGNGTCLVRHLVYNGTLTGVVEGSNLEDIEGCFALSNPITVTRVEQPEAGTIMTADGDTAMTICAGDGMSDAFEAMNAGATGENFQWVITDPNANILGLPDGPVFDLEGAGTGTCLLWYLSYNGNLQHAEVGNNVSDVVGCFALSNSITVTRNGVSAGMITTTDSITAFTMCAGDGVSDAFNVIISGELDGDSTSWIITDSEGMILGVPPGPPFDLEGAGLGTCLVWHISFNGSLEGVVVGGNSSDIVGCFALSNPITVTRVEKPEGGSIATAEGDTTLSICAGDGVSDAFEAISTGATGEQSLWVITDPEANILGLPEGPVFDLEGEGSGTCLVWYLSYNGNIDNAVKGKNVSEIIGCFGLSNPITVTRHGVDGGSITTLDSLEEVMTCPGDGVSDAFDVMISGNVDGDSTAWVITNTNGEILGVPAGPPFDLEGAGTGICLIWHIAYNGTLTGVEVGNNAADIEGCYDLSNAITVVRRGAYAGSITTSEGDTSITICAGDGVSDAFEVTISDDMEGENTAWVITDPNGNILGLPESPPFDLEGEGTGICLIWLVKYNGELGGVAVGNNTSQLTGCFALSNPITVTRQGVNAGTLMTEDSLTELSICAGDGISDAFGIIQSSDLDGDNSNWIITDQNGNILGLPDGPPFDLEEAGEGTCLIWYMRYNGEISGVEVGMNAENFEGCYDLSNPIAVTRTFSSSAGTIMTADGQTELSICAGDGISDAFDVEVNGADGANSAWIITDPNQNILGIPEGPPFDLEGEGTGVCLVWYVTYNGDIQNVTKGNNVSDIVGCFSVSNPITVTRTGVHAGTISTTEGETELNICAGDGISDAFEVNITDDVEGANTRWIITDSELNILGLPDGPPFDLEGAGTGQCLVWHVAYNGELSGVEVGANAGDIGGCFALSNSITVNRGGANGGSITTADGETELTICAGDGSSDAFEVSLSDDVDGTSTAWVITNGAGEILGLPEGPPFDLEGAGTGVCLIWHLSYSGELNGVEVGMNTNDLVGCFSFSNSITVTRTGVNAGTISTSDGEIALSICAGDGISDAFDVSISDDVEGASTSWIITDPDLNILGLPAGPPFDLEGAGTGTCLVWHVASNGDLTGVEVGANASDIVGCFALSNPITVSRSGANGGSITTTEGDTELTICAGDGISDAFDVTISDDIDGDEQAWIITDSDGNILGLPESPPFDLEGTGTGTCLVWYISYNGELSGVEVGLNAADLVGCYDLSNPITVTRHGVYAGNITTNNGSTSLTICAGDGESDAFDVVVSEDAEGENTDWVITDSDGNILGLPDGPPFDLEGAGSGVCQVWYLKYNGEISGVEVGRNTSDIEGCFAFSNPITVTRKSGAGCGSSGPLVLEHGSSEVAGDWKTIQLSNNYTSPVVVATVHTSGLGAKPVVTRVRNAANNQFELKVQNPGGTVTTKYKVSYTVVEEGVYNAADHGIDMEAIKESSEITASKARWKTENRTVNNSYESPIVLGQVMSYNDDDWSVFWASRQGIRQLAPRRENIAAGKHVGEDRDLSRADETVGIIIIEEGIYRINDEYLQAGMGYTIIQGLGTKSKGTTYTTNLTGITNGVASSAGMRSRDGGWPVLVGDMPFADSKIRLAIDEDQIRDKERRHIGSNVAYLVFGEARNTKKKKWNALASNDIVSEFKSNQELALDGVIYPNPTSGGITLNLEMDQQAKMTVRILDALGQIALQQEATFVRGSNSLRYELHDLSNGVYTIQVIADDRLRLGKKFFIQK